MFLFVSAAVFGEQLKDPKEIIQKAKARSLGLDSYSFSMYKEGWDFEMEKTAESTKQLTGEAKDSFIAKKYADNVKSVDAGAKYTKYEIDFKFKTLG